MSDHLFISYALNAIKNYGVVPILTSKDIQNVLDFLPPQSPLHAYESQQLQPNFKLNCPSTFIATHAVQPPPLTSHTCTFTVPETTLPPQSNAMSYTQPLVTSYNYATTAPEASPFQSNSMPYAQFSVINHNYSATAPEASPFQSNLTPYAQLTASPFNAFPTHGISTQQSNIMAYTPPATLTHSYAFATPGTSTQQQPNTMPYTQFAASSYVCTFVTPEISSQQSHVKPYTPPPTTLNHSYAFAASSPGTSTQQSYAKPYTPPPTTLNHSYAFDASSPETSTQQLNLISNAQPSVVSNVDYTYAEPGTSSQHTNTMSHAQSSSTQQTIIKSRKRASLVEYDSVNFQTDSQKYSYKKMKMEHTRLADTNVALDMLNDIYIKQLILKKTFSQFHSSVPLQVGLIQNGRIKKFYVSRENVTRVIGAGKFPCPLTDPNLDFEISLTPLCILREVNHYLRGYMTYICGACEKGDQKFENNEILEFGKCLTPPGKVVRIKNKKRYTKGLIKCNKVYILWRTSTAGFYMNTDPNIGWMDIQSKRLHIEHTQYLITTGIFIKNANCEGFLPTTKCINVNVAELEVEDFTGSKHLDYKINFTSFLKSILNTESRFLPIKFA